MGFLKTLPLSQARHVDRSNSESDDVSSSEHLKSTYSGISVSSTTKVNLPAQRRGWKPTSITPAVLVPVIIVSLGLGALVEYLAQRSAENGGLALQSDGSNTSTGVLLSRYVPTVVAVIYSLTWTWIDLDIRRVQPWLEMSKAEGGTGESTILLDYPFEFLALIPIKAWRKRHWLVFLVGTIMMLVFWAVTPLQSAVFGTQQVVITNDVAAVDTAQLGTPEQQVDALDSSILNTAYGITWLQQPYPSFTTDKYAFIPFEPMKATVEVLPNENWTASATALSTSLDCWPAIVDQVSELSQTFDFDNGQGCKATVEPPSHGRLGNETGFIHTVLYIGYAENPQLDWFLQNPNCSQTAMHQFLAIWIAQDTKDMTALFCEPSYWKQPVMVTVSASNKAPDASSIVPLGNPERLGDAEFNSTAFEYLIGTGAPPKQIRRDYPNDLTAIEQYPTLAAFNLAWPITNMVGFALGGMNYSITDLKDTTVLQDVFSGAHKKLFSAAMPSLLQAVNHSSAARPSSVQYVLYGVVVNRPLALTVEIFLVIIALLASAILFISRRTASALVKDPGRIGSTLAIMGHSDAMLRDFTPRDKFDDENLRSSVRGKRYRLAQVDAIDGPRLCIEYSSVPENSHESERAPGPTLEATAQPQALKPLSGLAFVVTLLAGMVILSYLKKRELALGGLPRPSQNFTVLQLLENYVPTIFATMLEPFFVLLNRLLCLFQPFHDLRKGRKTAAQAFQTPYTILPPQLCLWQSLSRGHILLASLCLVSLLANVLAVALGALFNEAPVMASYPVAVQQILSSSVTPSAFQTDVGFLPTYDQFYVTAANLSTGTRLIPWTDAEFAYLPFSSLPRVGRDVDDSSSTYRARTRGFGADVTCSSLPSSAASLPYVDYVLQGDGSQSIGFFFPATNGLAAKCIAAANLPRTQWLNDSNSPVPGTIAQELVSALYPDGGRSLHDDGGPCDRKLVLSWWRIDPADRAGTQRASHMYCVPTWRSAMFDVTVDGDGYVLTASQVGDFDHLDDITRNQTDIVLTTMIDDIGIGAASATATDIAGTMDDDSWHNDTLTRDWLNYFLKLQLNSTVLIDPAQPVPNLNDTFGPVENVLKMLVATTIGGHFSTMFEAASSPAQLAATQLLRETRIFMDRTAFAITIAILGLMVVVATTLYLRERKPFLPRLPSTIGSLVAYVAASQAVREYSTREEVGESGRHSYGREATYSFGKFVGVDSREHVGIEVDPFVTPADAGVGAGARFRGWLNRSRRRTAVAGSSPS